MIYHRHSSRRDLLRSAGGRRSSFFSSGPGGRSSSVGVKCGIKLSDGGCSRTFPSALNLVRATTPKVSCRTGPGHGSRRMRPRDCSHRARLSCRRRGEGCAADFPAALTLRRRQGTGSVNDSGAKLSESCSFREPSSVSSTPPRTVSGTRNSSQCARRPPGNTAPLNASPIFVPAESAMTA